MKSRASIQNDVTAIRDEIASINSRDALVRLLTSPKFKGLPDREQTALRDAVNARWKVVQ
jgi:hypothetical protein